MDFRNRLKLARLYEEGEDWDRMHAILSEATHLEVRNLDLLELQATAHRRRREFGEATERTLATVALLEMQNPEDLRVQKAELFCAVGEDWLARGRKDKAREYAREALRLLSGMDRARKLFDASRE